MAETLPTCQCVASQPPFDRLTSIYAVLRQLADDDTLPSVQCVRAKSPYDRLTDIFCAALSWSGGGTIPELLGILNIADNSQILSFSRIEAAGFTGSGDPDRYQREAAVNVLRKNDFVGASNTDGPDMLIEDDPTLCVLVAPTNIVGTDNGDGTFDSTGTGVPVTVSLLRYDWRLDDVGVWTGNGTSLTLANISASAGSHVLNWRAVSTSGVAGDTGTSAPFTVTAGFADIIFYWGMEATPFSDASKAAGSATGTVHGNLLDSTSVVKVGAHSAERSDASGCYATFVPTANIDVTKGGIGLWFYFGNGTNDFSQLFRFGNGADLANNQIFLSAQSSGQIFWYYKAGGVGLSKTTAGVPMLTDGWYWVQMMWDQVGNAYTLSVWNAADVNIITDSASDATGAWAAVDTMQIGDADSIPGNPCYYDNVIVTNDPARDLHALRNDTSF